MLKPGQLSRLIGAIRSNQCLLFLGAGFSAGAQNSLGGTIPAGWELARRLWLRFGYEAEHGPYENTPLHRLFDAARKRLGDASLADFLEQQLLVEEYPEWYVHFGRIFGEESTLRT
jgi:hypothetical protein